MENAVEDGYFPFSRLPDDIVVQVYNKIMDLKTLCYCQLISKRLGLLVFQADTVSFNVPLPIDYENEDRLDDIKMAASSVIFESLRYLIKEAASRGALSSDPARILESDSFPSAIKFIKRFMKLKSICIQFPSYVNVVVDGVFLLKWKIKFGTRVDSFVIRARNWEDILEEKGSSDEEQEDIDDDEEAKDKGSDEYFKAYSCWRDVVDRFKKVLGCTVEFPLLEKVFIMDSDERGVVTLSGGEIDELMNLLHLRETSKEKLIHSVELSDAASGRFLVASHILANVWKAIHVDS